MVKHQADKGFNAERFEQIKARYATFLESMDNMNVEPIKVFEPLPQTALDELELIREVSVVLQKKKDEDVRKAAEVAEEEKAKQAETVEAVEGEETAESEEVKEKPETEKEN